MDFKVPRWAYVVFVPQVLLLLGYVYFFAVPQYRELQLLSKSAAGKRDEVAKVEHSLAEKKAEWLLLKEEVEIQSGSSRYVSADVRNRSKTRTSAQALSAVMDIFEAEGVICESTSLMEQSSGGLSKSETGYQLHLVGSFLKMKSALSEITDRVPELLLDNFQLTLEDSFPHQWDVSLRFREDFR